jgi:hypothetical protein
MLRQLLAGFFFPRDPRGDTENESYVSLLVHTPNPYVQDGQVYGGINPVRTSPFFVSYPQGAVNKARKLMGYAASGAIGHYDGTASELDPWDPMVMDALDPVWFPELSNTIQPNAMPYLNLSTDGASA